ncbi:hypothetical protein N431DRAFT_338661 [Stipitochalara longipes BDJ]|nr:hypothetical protein N431DRAFT_338661 [Stipitochalara longipes BDJ]
MPPPARRPYKRISPQEWDKQKDQIWTLYIDQDQSITEVAQNLKDKYGFDAGEKQFKRKVDEWGFTKNIASREMVKMVQKRKRREDEQGKATVFKRSRNGVDFEVVAPVKLDRFQKRNRLEELESGSESSGMPSNILYGTPSNNHTVHSIRRDVSTTLSRRHTPIGEMESLDGTNKQVQQILERALNQPPCPTSFQTMERWGRDGSRLVFQKRYSEAQKAFEEDAVKVAAWIGKRCWVAVGLRHEAAMMEAASHPGCPETLSLRFTQELSRRLMIEQQAYLALPSHEQSTTELQHIFATLVESTRSWTEVITSQKALEIWEPILGPNNRELTLIRKRLKEHEQIPGCPIEEVLLDPGVPAQPFKPIQHFLHHQHDGPADKLLELAPFLEFSTDNLSSEVRDEMLLLRRGRSHAFLGGYYSFLRHFEKAEQSFQESQKTLEAETCVEIKLHRMLWHCEHYTRVQNLDRVGFLLYEAHRVFMAQETASTFVISHFPDRFRLLCKAVSACVPIDEVVHDVATYTRDDPSGNWQQSIQAQTPKTPSSVLEVEILFPLGSTDHSTIDIDAWRQYVTFSSRASSLIQSPTTGHVFLPSSISLSSLTHE